MTLQPNQGSTQSVGTLHSAIEDLDRELGGTPTLSALLNDAIRHGDQGIVRDTCGSLDNLSTLAPKRLAIMHGYPELLKILLEKNRLIDNSVVEMAGERKDRDSIRILLDFGWPINKPLRQDMSVLDFAIDDLDFMQFLVRLGADVNARSKLDESALSIAIVRGKMDVVRYLIEKETDLAHGDLLHCAAERVNQFEGADLVDDLVKRGAVVCAYRYYNPVAFRWRGLYKQPTPLHIACESGNIPVAEALLRHGADPHQLMLEAGKPTRPSSLEVAGRRSDQILLDLLTGDLAAI